MKTLSALVLLQALLALPAVPGNTLPLPAQGNSLPITAQGNSLPITVQRAASLPAESTPQDKHFFITRGHVEPSGDTIPLVNLPNTYVYAPETFSSKKQERYYWKTVRDVRLCLPLSKIVSATLIETTEYMRTLPDDKAREKHLRQMERDLIRQYEPTLRHMTYGQGKILLKLIVRECDSSPYEILQGYLGTFAADFWQGIARLFTADLKTDYRPDNEDALIERIATRIEQGQL